MTTGSPPPPPVKRRDRIALRLLPVLMALPFRWRVAIAGWTVQFVIGRLSNLRRRVLASVKHFLPDLPDDQAQRIAATATGNFARMAMEVLSPDDLGKLAADLPVDGPGLDALTEARTQGRAAVLVSGHFGNYDVPRLALNARGFNVGGYYKDLGNPALNTHYVRAIEASGAPMFPDTSDGRKGLIRFLRKGGMFGILIDLDRPHGVMLDFLGKPTRTVLSIAEMALKYDAILVPMYGIRTTDPAGFRVRIEAPIPHDTPRAMTQALNDSFGAQVRAHPEQWVWWHNRRKGSHPDVTPPT